MTLRPAEVHPEKHLRPVGGLRAPRACRDREDRVLPVVVAGEEEEGPFALEQGGQGVALTLQFGLEFGVGRIAQHGEEFEQVVDPLLDAAPEGELVAQALGLAEHGLGEARIVPEGGFGAALVERRQARFLGPEVKDAPRSTGSAPPDR